MLCLTRKIGERLDLYPPSDLLIACERFRDHHPTDGNLDAIIAELNAAIARAKAAKPIAVTITSIEGNRVKLGINAPDDVLVMRSEVEVRDE